MTEMPDVHVDWHMTLAEWDELRGVLLRNTGYEYIGRLEAAGALKRPLSSRDGTAAQPQPAPGDVGYLGSDALARRYGEALQRIVDADPSDAVDKLARNALGLTRVPRPKPQPARELAAAMAETRHYRELVNDILRTFKAAHHGDSYRSDVGKRTFAKWREAAGPEAP